MINTDVTIELLAEQRVLQFAKQQFTELLEAAVAGAAAGSAAIDQAVTIDRVVIGTFAQLQTAAQKQASTELRIASQKQASTEPQTVVQEQMPTELQTASQSRTFAPQLVSLLSSKLAAAAYSDEFVIHIDKQTLYLIGITPRAALYAVYHYFEIQYGMNWIFPGQPPVFYRQEQPFLLQKQEPFHTAPLVERRGLVIETIDDVPFITALIDWLAKQKINELFFTFTLWDNIGSQLQDMLLDRGIDLTLGGHSTSFFLKQLESKPVADHPYTAKRQLDYSDLSWQDELFEKITDYCQPIACLTRISLWPEDIKHQSSKQFLTHYIQFTERLQQKLHSSGLALEVEHIAYNAGLAWDMLERQDQVLSSQVNTLFAYWGRDYSESLEQSLSASDKKAYTALIDWQEQTKNNATKLTIFEYYSDHFMLSPLFPMLANRIVADIKHYVTLGVHGITNLIVPTNVERYPYQWNQNFNCYIFARTLWNDPLDDMIAAFIEYFPADIRLTVRTLLLELEQEVAVLTSWNVPFFPARAVDPLKTSAVPNEERTKVVQQLERIIKLTQHFLSLDELKSLEQLHATLVHYERYAQHVKEQWLSLSN